MVVVINRSVSPVTIEVTTTHQSGRPDRSDVPSTHQYSLQLSSDTTYNAKWTAEQSRYVSDQYLLLHCRHISVSTVKYLSEQSHKMSCVVSHIINRTIPEKVTSFWAEQAPRPARVSAHILRKQEPVRWEKILAFMSGSLLRCNTPMMQNTPHSSDSDDLICTLN